MDPVSGRGAGAGAGEELQPPGPRVFLSHSTDEPFPHAVRGRLAGKLRAAGYRVLLDKDGLRPGEGWRNPLELWIGCCDAAVVLVSEKALTSGFVAHEVSVLAYRQRFQRQPPFVLVPVFISPVSYRRVKESPLAASFLTEIEPVRIAETAGVGPKEERILDLDAGVSAVVERLREAVVGPGPLDTKLDELTSLLETVPVHHLEQEALRLGVHFEEAWLPYGAGEPRRLARKLACSLVGAPLDEAKKSLYTIRSYLRSPRHGPASGPVLQALDLVASSWVSAQSALQIRRALRTGDRAFCADCIRPLTAEMYVARACTEPLIPENRWTVGQVDGLVGEGAAVELEALVRAELERVLGVAAEGLRKELELIRDEEQLQVFVSLPVGSLDVPTIDHLRDRFPGVSFFLMTGSSTDEEPSAEVLERGRIERLRPPFRGLIEEPDYPPVDENRFEKLYRGAYRLVTRKLAKEA